MDMRFSLVLLLCLLLTSLSSESEGHTPSAPWPSHEACSSCKRRGDSHCLRRLNDPVGMGEVRYLAKHGSRATVAFLGKLHRAFHPLTLNLVPPNNLLH